MKRTLTELASMIVSDLLVTISSLLPFHFQIIMSLLQNHFAIIIDLYFSLFLSGLTSIGASSVVFPVLTLIYEVSPKVARDFGMFSQAIGLTCAVCTVFLMKVRVEWNAIIFCGFGGSIGLILGLEVIERLMPPSLKKMIFASFWFSFAFALFFLNRNRERKTFSRIYSMNWWKAIILIICGIVGGIFGSFVGSGIDICSLSILTLFFRLSEKSASPTTLVIIASNSVLGLIWRQGIQSNVSMETWEYTAVSAVVIVVGAPIGSFIGAHFRRQVIAWFIYLLVTLTLITSFVLIPQTPVLIGVSIGVILLGAGMFALLTYFGHILLEKYKRESENCGQNDVIVKQMAQKGNSVTPIAITHL